MSSGKAVLVVGAGGIGCELLKNLVFNGFENITIVDLDTIDISNLNRQFLFHREHVGRSKAEVAREKVLTFKPSAKITAYHKSIFSSSFDSEFFQQFDIVFNALDNQAARKHVNRMCVAAKLPLIESGTAGYLGQVEPLIPKGSSEKFVTENDINSNFFTGCFECQPRATGQRHYPACTIRNTPSEPIHCVIWAKYLFNQLFGEPDVHDEDVSPDFSDPSLFQNSNNLSSNSNSDNLHNNSSNNTSNFDSNQDFNQSADSLNKLGNNYSVTSIHSNPERPTNYTDENLPIHTTLREWFHKQCQISACTTTTTTTMNTISNNQITNFEAGYSLAWRLFHHDLATLVGMRDLWVDRQDRREPSPLERSILDDCVKNDSNLSNDSETIENEKTELRDQRKYALSGWLRMFIESLHSLQRRSSTSDQALIWDKDDIEAMDFVAAASIIRAQLFHLPDSNQLTRFTIKSLAGNIIPAIASTNAIIAGLMVLQAKHILAGNLRRVRTLFLHRQPTGRLGNRRLIVPCTPTSQNPSCIVCSDSVRNSQLQLVCAPELLTLRILRDNILIKYLGMLSPDVEFTDRGIILISSEEGETDEDTLDKSLADFKISQGSCLQCDDFRQDFNIRLVVSCISPESAHSLPNSRNNNSSNDNNNKNNKTENYVNSLFDLDGQNEQWQIVGNVNNIHSDTHNHCSLDNEVSLSNGSVPNKETVNLIDDNSLKLCTPKSNQSVDVSNTNIALKRKLPDTTYSVDEESVKTMVKKVKLDSNDLLIIPDGDDEDDDLILIE